MSTMFDTLMDLPLLKGLNDEQFYAFLEKTNLQFLNYDDKECLIKAGDLCNHIKFVITGQLRITRRICYDRVVVDYLLPEGSVIAPDYLFGIDTHYPFDAYAIGKVSVLQFRKDEYIRLLQSNDIFLMNFSNYLSLRVQRPLVAYSEYCGKTLADMFAFWIKSYTEQESRDININCTIGSMRELCCKESLSSELDEMMQKNLICINGDCINILSRNDFLEYAREKHK